MKLDPVFGWEAGKDGPNERDFRAPPPGGSYYPIHPWEMDPYLLEVADRGGLPAPDRFDVVDNPLTTN